MKEIMGNNEKIIDNYLDDLKRVVEDWTEIDEDGITKDGKDESDVRMMEGELIPPLIEYLKRNPEICQARESDIKFIAIEYLRIGDHGNLKSELAKILGIGYHDPLSGEDMKPGDVGPDLALKSIQKEIAEFGGEKTKIEEQLKKDIDKIEKMRDNKDVKVH